MKRNFYDDRDSGWMYLLALTVPAAVGIIAFFILRGIAGRFGIADFTKDSAFYTIYMVIISLSFLGMFLVYNTIKRVDIKKASLIKVNFGWKNLILCVIIAVVTLFGFNLFINYLFHLLEGVGYTPDSSLPLPLNNGWWLVANLVILAAMPAIFEEFIYRGVILNGLRRFGNVNAVMISALLFALAHGSAMQFPYQFILGVVLGFVMIKTGSILASMIVHFLNNAIVIVYNYIVPLGEQIFSTEVIILSFVIAISAVGLLFLLIFALKEKKQSQISYNEEYNKISEARQGFTDYKSKVIFITTCCVSAFLWVLGTFF